VKRAVNWLERATKGELVTENERFELPEFSLSNVSQMKFVFSEDMVSFMQWESVECQYGMAELDVYKSIKITKDSLSCLRTTRKYRNI
jgi:hypothetical protein